MLPARATAPVKTVPLPTRPTSYNSHSQSSRRGKVSVNSDYVELLSASGGDCANRHYTFRRSSATVAKVFDDRARTFVYEIVGEPSSSVRLSTPATPGQSLHLAHTAVALQVLVPADDNDFSFVLTVGEATRSTPLTITCGTKVKKVDVDGDSALVPLTSLVKDRVSMQHNVIFGRIAQWVTACIHLPHATKQLWPWAVYSHLNSIAICGNCRLKRVFTMKQSESPLVVPKVFELRHGEGVSQILAMDGSIGEVTGE